jgi:hypothetical protein
MSIAVKSISFRSKAAVFSDNFELFDTAKKKSKSKFENVNFGFFMYAYLTWKKYGSQTCPMSTY